MAPIPPDPNPFDFFLRLLFLFAFGFFTYFGISQSAPSPIPLPGGGDGRPPSGVFESLTVIEQVETLILESYPYQITLQVKGYQPDGCDFPVQVEQRREGNTVYVKIFRQVPMDVMCTMQLIPYEAAIPLEGGFESGEYSMDVNGVMVEVKL